MWGLLKALVTQLHVNVEPATPSSSSTAMEPSPAQGNRRKDKAPMSPEDSKDDNEDISKPIPGGKSLSLAQGSGASLYKVGLLNPRAKSLSNLYENIVRAVRKVSIGTHCSFPPNDNAGFSKEGLLHVSTLRKQFKALHTVLQLCVGLAGDGRVLVDIYSIIVTILYTMHLQLDAPDNIYIKHKYGKETLCHFAILDNSNLVGECQAAYSMPLHWPMPALLTGAPTETQQTRTTASKAARRRMPPLLTSTNPLCHASNTKT